MCKPIRGALSGNQLRSKLSSSVKVRSQSSSFPDHAFTDSFKLALMSTLPYAIARSAKRTLVYGQCRRICRRRLPQPCRTFRTNAFLRASAVDESADAGQTAGHATIQKLVDEAVRKATAGLTSTHRDAEEGQAEGSPPIGDKGRLADRKYYGSWRKRASRGVQEFQMTVPEWFVNENITLWEEASSRAAPVESQEDHEVETRSTDSGSPLSQDQSISASHDVKAESESEAQASQQEESKTALLGNRYKIRDSILEEIRHMISGGLRSSSAFPSESALLSRPHLLLQSPQPGSENFLKNVVSAATASLEADLIEIDAQDMAAVAANLPDALPEQTIAAVKRLGFDTYVYEDDPDHDPGEDGTNDHEAMDDATEAPMESHERPVPAKVPTLNLGNLKPLQQMIQVWLPQRKSGHGTTQNIPRNGHPSIADFFTSTNGITTPQGAVQQDFIHVLLRAFLDAPHLKRRKEIMRAGEQSKAGNSNLAHPELPRSLVVHIRDYLEISATSIGAGVLDKIHAAVDAKRRDGQPVLIVGTTASTDLFPESISEEGFKAIQMGNDSDRFRTIVTMCANEDAEGLFIEDASKRTVRINFRNVQAVVNDLYPEAASRLQSSQTPEAELQTLEQSDFDLTKGVWPLEKVQRLVTLAYGVTKPEQRIDAAAILRARTVIHDSDREKMVWASSQEKTIYPSDFPSVVPNVQEETRKAVLKNSDRYEKKLMTGVVDANKIKTSFADVHVPPSSIEAVKTLTTLSLVRPDAFSYGVLATDKIPGLLLYGPPGTGKTMLAKAVAKESGATVLEVSGSEIYDMYVGEGEKNVRAIFSLAKKLSPCVVFIDEADAIFGARSGGINRRSHRELINQFLKEWDGMNEMSTFIMVATNRPFDLDDAVLRRLPRRLLVDLPSEKDREAILRIHLKDEVVEDDVSLSDLASRTPFYSGSDLKNVAVAAALACVREENEAAAKHVGVAPYEYPSKRTLTREHFESALAEISASISEDMSSLKAIRKFDERYGDRRGRKKRSGGLGFGTQKESDLERDKLDGGRVRKLELAV